MKMAKCLSLCAMIVTILIPALSFGGTIKALAKPMTSSAVKEQQLVVPVTVDISSLPEKLGSYTASLRWDSRVLKYAAHQPGSTTGFTSPVVNAGKAGEGVLTFAAANPYGAEGTINILNVIFEVIGSEGARSDLKLEFSAMAAANTYADLLPYLQTAQTGVERGITVGGLPDEFSLAQNYPNPFNPSTKIGYSLPDAEHVTVTIYNALGQKVRTLVDEQKGAGTYELIWDGRDNSGKEAPVGVYLYKLQAGSFSEMKQMLFVK
jgi:hypothetical protein